MISSWYSTPERIEALERECGKWLGTPFSGNGCVPGIGVSCQMFVASVYSDSGFSPDLKKRVPEGPMSYWRFAKKSIVAEFLDAQKEFTRLDPALETPVPGDLLGFRLGLVIHHLGIAKDNKNFIHAIESAGVTNSSLLDATWMQRLEAIWRPTHDARV